MDRFCPDLMATVQEAEPTFTAGDSSEDEDELVRSDSHCSSEQAAGSTSWDADYALALSLQQDEVDDTAFACRLRPGEWFLHPTLDGKRIDLERKECALLTLQGEAVSTAKLWGYLAAFSDSVTTASEFVQ